METRNQHIGKSVALCNTYFQPASNLALPGDQFTILDVGKFEDVSEEIQIYVTLIAKYLIVASFGQDSENPTFDEDVMHFLSGGSLYLVTDHENPVALRKHRLVNIDTNRVLLLMASVTHPAYQQNGIMSSLIRQLIRNLEPQFISLRTQNPLYYEIASKFSETVFPSTDPKEMIPPMIRRIGETVSKTFGCLHFDPNTFVDVGKYGQATHAVSQRQRSHYEHVNSLFDTKLNYARGDSLLIIGPSRIEDGGAS